MFKKVLIVTVLLISFASSASANTLYEVKKGDTLSKIAKLNKVTINDIRSWNKLTKDSVYIKQKLVVKKPAVATKTPAKVVTTKPVVVTSASKQETVVTPVQVKDAQLITAPFQEQEKSLSGKGQAMYPLIVDFAKRLEGIPYVYGGYTMSGFDCSGFIYFLHTQAGLDITRQSSESYFAQTSVVSIPVVGDLVFFQNTYKQGISHMGIYIGDNKFIHAGSKGVEVTSLDSSYWKEHFVSFNRFNALTVK
ncbi:peptidoglycan endopeptidase LytE [Psychrobacillus psychrotolerans]|uniref:Peptidoglycan endopeptidase LytE n=1 Tax=Psychrobacillus psychrotolerans TaxID=126156 RepID=A0A1I5ZAX2_9BACI|nr:C40 family peptidase [Psychrobacillus psychrotolerans]SFQ53604.1 peptidoglycan endopeptidase LytE [Psychrobacillus psychrotolerans]